MVRKRFQFHSVLADGELARLQDGGAAWATTTPTGKPDILLSGDDAGTHPLAGKAYANTGSPGFTVDSRGSKSRARERQARERPPSATTTTTAGSTRCSRGASRRTSSRTPPRPPTPPRPFRPAPPSSRDSTSATFSWTPRPTPSSRAPPHLQPARGQRRRAARTFVPSTVRSRVGKRLAPAPGNVGEATSYTLTGLTRAFPTTGACRPWTRASWPSAFSAEAGLRSRLHADKHLPRDRGGHRRLRRLQLGRQARRRCDRYGQLEQSDREGLSPGLHTTLRRIPPALLPLLDLVGGHERELDRRLGQLGPPGATTTTTGTSIC